MAGLTAHLRLYALPYLWAGFILFATIANVGTLRRLYFTDLFSYDKPIHIFLFGMQAHLWIRTRNRNKIISLQQIRWICTWVMVYGLATEMFQSWFTTTRQFDWFDWIADALGCTIVYAAYAFARRKKEKLSQRV